MLDKLKVFEQRELLFREGLVLWILYVFKTCFRVSTG